MKRLSAGLLKVAGSVCVLLAVGLTAGIATCRAASEFRPGEVWRDTDGNPINAHAGGLLFHEGVYYWYGEAKSGRTFLPDCNKSWGGTRVDLTGVSCYSSTNLYDWKNEGLALAAVPNDPEHDLHTSKVLERPKVIYNASTKLFVMWMHIDSPNYAAARAGVATSATPTGPFKYLGSARPDPGAWPQNVSDADKRATNSLGRDFKPGQMARDLTVFVDDDAKAYLIYASEDNATLHITRLTDDYLRTTGNYVQILNGRSMEAPALFKRGAKYYLIASGCTAWAPNAARSASADHIFGPWTELGNPCVGDNADKTFLSQGTYVLPLPTSAQQFIFLADRWKQWDLADSRHVWLPIEFGSDGKPAIHWRDRWSLPSP